MKLVFFLLILLGSVAGATAQQNHFIYLQTDDKQPFYVTINQIVYSSSSSGYAIIPRLQKGDYQLQIGFPKNRWPEQTIQVPVQSDAGYALKNFGDKGWGLFNLQSLDVLMAVEISSSNKTSTETANVSNDGSEDGFASTLAGIVNTPDLAKKQVVEQAEPVQSKEEPKEVIIPEVVAASVVETKAGETPVQVQPGFQEARAIVPVVSQPEKSSIAKLSEVVDEAGFAMRYTDVSISGVDTIQIFIPDVNPDRNKPTVTAVPKPVVVMEEKKEEPKSQAIVAIETEAKKPETKTEPKDARFLDIEMPVKGEPAQQELKTVKPVTESTASETAVTESKQDEQKQANTKKEQLRTEEIPKDKPVVSLNSDCKKFATDDDFFRTRKRMAAEPDAESMIQSAKKRFKAACYTTEQIKNLSVLFLKDETRYNFFDAAYPFVSDAENFSQLEAALNDEYYINRFKAMIR